jgi:hypothetical protein
MQTFAEQINANRSMELEESKDKLLDPWFEAEDSDDSGVVVLNERDASAETFW